MMRGISFIIITALLSSQLAFAHAPIFQVLADSSNTLRHYLQRPGIAEVQEIEFGQSRLTDAE